MGVKIYRKLAAAVAASGLMAASHAATTVVMVGDNDGFGGTQGAVSLPGQPFAVFPAPSIAPGSYAGVAGTDATTVSPWTPYVFTFSFAWNTASLTTIDSAVVQVQSGSVGRRADNSGFGFAKVSVDAGSGYVLLGDFWPTSTGSSASSLEESVKMHTFDVKAFLSPQSSGVLTLKIDGSSLVNPADQFALDFARLTVSSVPESSSGALLLLGLLPLCMAASRRRSA